MKCVTPTLPSLFPKLCFGTTSNADPKILIAILTTFPTASLLPLAATSHRFHALILRILETRLSAASTLASHTLILEVFHPATKLSTPYLFCAPIPSSPTPKIKCDGVGRLGEMREGYTSFRPLQPEADRLPRRPGPPLPTSTNTNASVATSAQDTSGEAGLVTQDIHLESHELFSQLCTITNLVKVGPKRGLFLSCVSVGEGILRIWRDWLAATAQAQACTFQLGSAPITQTGEKDQGAMLWADKGENVGLRMNIERLEAVPGRAGEDEAVSYRVGYEGMCLFIFCRFGVDVGRGRGAWWSI